MKASHFLIAAGAVLCTVLAATSCGSTFSTADDFPVYGPPGTAVSTSVPAQKCNDIPSIPGCRQDTGWDKTVHNCAIVQPYAGNTDSIDSILQDAGVTGGPGTVLGYVDTGDCQIVLAGSNSIPDVTRIVRYRGTVSKDRLIPVTLYEEKIWGRPETISCNNTFGRPCRIEPCLECRRERVDITDPLSGSILASVYRVTGRQTASVYGTSGHEKRSGSGGSAKAQASGSKAFVTARLANSPMASGPGSHCRFGPVQSSRKCTHSRENAEYGSLHGDLHGKLVVSGSFIVNETHVLSVSSGAMCEMGAGWVDHGLTHAGTGANTPNALADAALVMGPERSSSRTELSAWVTCDGTDKIGSGASVRGPREGTLRSYL
jgi:hypothetical protein